MTGRLTRQEAHDQTECISSGHQSLDAHHEAARQKQQGDVNHNQVDEDNPGGSGCGNREYAADNEPHPHEYRHRLVELGIHGAGRVGIRCHDARSGEINHAIGPVEGRVGTEDRCTELDARFRQLLKIKCHARGRGTYRVSSNELHDAREELTQTTKEHQHADHDIRVLDASGLQSKHGDEEDIYNISIETGEVANRVEIPVAKAISPNAAGVATRPCTTGTGGLESSLTATSPAAAGMPSE